MTSRLNIPVTATIALLHALALLAFVPAMLSWSGVALANAVKEATED